MLQKQAHAHLLKYLFYYKAIVRLIPLCTGDEWSRLWEIKKSFMFNELLSHCFYKVLLFSSVCVHVCVTHRCNTCALRFGCSMVAEQLYLHFTCAFRCAFHSIAFSVSASTMQPAWLWCAFVKIHGLMEFNGSILKPPV